MTWQIKLRSRGANKHALLNSAGRDARNVSVGAPMAPPGCGVLVPVSRVQRSFHRAAWNYKCVWLHCCLECRPMILFLGLISSYICIATLVTWRDGRWAVCSHASCWWSKAWLWAETLCSVAELPVVPLVCALFAFEERGAAEYNETDHYFIQNVSFPPRLWQKVPPEILCLCVCARARKRELGVSAALLFLD